MNSINNFEPCLLHLFNSLVASEHESVLAQSKGLLTVSEAKILAAVKFLSATNNNRQKDLCTYLCLTPSTLSIYVTSLEKKKYVVKKHNKKGGRKIFIELTQKALRFLKARAKYHNSIMSSLVSKLGEEEVRTLVTTIQKTDNLLGSPDCKIKGEK